MEPVNNSPQIVAESKMMDESKTKNKKDRADKTNESKTKNKKEDSYKFSDSSLIIKCDVKKCTSDEAQIYVTVANPTRESINISDNLTGFKKYIKEKNLVFEKCLLDFDVIEDERKELKINLASHAKKQFSIFYKKPVVKKDFEELLEQQGGDGSLEKTKLGDMDKNNIIKEKPVEIKKSEDYPFLDEIKWDEKNTNIEIEVVEIKNSEKDSLCVSNIKKYFREKKPEKNYKFLKYTIEEDIENILGTEPDEVIKYENADILINPNSKVRICAIYSKLENKKTSDGIKADVYCNLRDLKKGSDYSFTVSEAVELAPDSCPIEASNLVKKTVTINNSNSSSRLHVIASSFFIKKYFEEDATFAYFHDKSTGKLTLGDVEVTVDPKSTGSFDVYFKKLPEDVYFNLSDLKKKSGYKLTVSEPTKLAGNLVKRKFTINNPINNKLHVVVQADYLKKNEYFNQNSSFSYFYAKSTDESSPEYIKIPSEDVMFTVGPKSNYSFEVYFKEEPKDVYFNLSDLEKKPEYKLTVSGPTKLASNLVKRKFTINNPNNSRLHVKAKSDDLKKHFKNGAKFSRFSGNSIVKKTNEEIELVVDPQSTGSFEACFKEEPEEPKDVYCNLSDFEGKSEYELYNEGFTELDGLVTNWFRIKNSSDDRLHVTVHADEIKKRIGKDLTVINFSGDSIKKNPDNSITVEVAPRSSDCRFAVTFRDTSKDIHCNLSELVDSGYCTPSYHGRVEEDEFEEGETDLVEKEFTIKNPLKKGTLYVTLEADYFKKRYFAEGATFSCFCDELKEVKKDKKIELVVGPQESRSFKVYFEDKSVTVYTDTTYVDFDEVEKIKNTKGNLIGKRFKLTNNYLGILRLMVDVDSLKPRFLQNTSYFSQDKSNFSQNTSYFLQNNNFVSQDLKFAYLYEKRIGKTTNKKIELVVNWGDSATFEVYFRNGNSKDVYCRLGDLEGNDKCQLTVSEPYKKDNLAARKVTINNQDNTRTLYVTADAFYLKQQYFGKNGVFSHFRKYPNGEDINSKQIELEVKPNSTLVFDVYFTEF